MARRSSSRRAAVCVHVSRGSWRWRAVHADAPMARGGGGRGCLGAPVGKVDTTRPVSVDGAAGGWLGLHVGAEKPPHKGRGASKHCCRGSWPNSTIQNDGGTFGNQCIRHDVRCRRVDNASAVASIALCHVPAGSLRCMRYGSQWSPRRRWTAHHSIQRPQCDWIMGRNRFVRLRRREESPAPSDLWPSASIRPSARPPTLESCLARDPRRDEAHVLPKPR